jgi:hypothetical protein
MMRVERAKMMMIDVHWICSQTIINDKSGNIQITQPQLRRY